MQLYQLSFPNGKKYIGITSKTVKERFIRHCAPANNKNACQRAIHKYGKENVIVTVLAECDNWELLCLSEMEAIEKFNTIAPNGYNLTLGGEGNTIVGIYGEERIIRDKEIKSIRDKSRPKRNEYQKKYRESTKEAQKEAQKAYRINNAETIKRKRMENTSGFDRKEYDKNYRILNKKSRSDYAKKYYKEKKIKTECQQLDLIDSFA